MVNLRDPILRFGSSADIAHILSSYCLAGKYVFTVSDRIIENKKGSVETANLRKKRCVISVKKCAGFFFYNCFFSIIQSEGRWSFHIFHN